MGADKSEEKLPLPRLGAWQRRCHSSVLALELLLSDATDLKSAITRLREPEGLTSAMGEELWGYAAALRDYLRFFEEQLEKLTNFESPDDDPFHD